MRSRPADPAAPEFGPADSRADMFHSGRADYFGCCAADGLLATFAFSKWGKGGFPVSPNGELEAALAGSLSQANYINGSEMFAIAAALAALGCRRTLVHIDYNAAAGA